MKRLHLIALLVFLFGCGHLSPTGVYKGDKFLYQVELGQPAAYKVVDAFLSWELDNRPLLLKTNPGITTAADRIRAGYPQWDNTVIVLRNAYVGDPSADNRTKLQQAFAILQAAMAEASGYLLNAANGK